MSLLALDVDGGRALAIHGDGGVLELEGPTRALELQLSEPVRNARIRLFDWNEQLVESDDVLLESQEGRVTGYRLELLEPLRSGRSYLLGIDGELGPRLLDAIGNDLDDLRVPFLVRGDPEPERPPAKRRQPSKRRAR